METGIAAASYEPDEGCFDKPCLNTEQLDKFPPRHVEQLDPAFGGQKTGGDKQELTSVSAFDYIKKN
jgi:hypothetical protein